MSIPLVLSGGPWLIVNDGVMGGRSAGRCETIGPALRFAGDLSLANNGGFSSVRHALQEPPADAVGIRIEARGDGREYQLRLRQGERFDDIAWRVLFRPNADWNPFAWRLDAFEPVFRGRPVPDAGHIDPSTIGQVGLLIADGHEGPFQLEVRRFEFLTEPD